MHSGAVATFSLAGAGATCGVSEREDLIVHREVRVPKAKTPELDEAFVVIEAAMVEDPPSEVTL